MRTTPALTDTHLIFGEQNAEQGAHIVSVDRATGKKQWTSPVDKTPGAHITQSPIVVPSAQPGQAGRVYVGVASGQETQAAHQPGYKCCTFQGSIAALDTTGGSVMQQTFLTPDPPADWQKIGADHLYNRYSGVAVWGSTAVVDQDRNALYITTGNNYTVPQLVMECIADCLNRSCDTKQIQACLSRDSDNYVDSIVALDLETFAVKWSFQGVAFDTWTKACIDKTTPNPQNCPKPTGPDYDFAQGPSLFTTKDGRPLLGAGNKGGVYWALDPDNGEVVWQTTVGPGGVTGGLQWGSATDGERIYIAVSNSSQTKWSLEGKGPWAGETVQRGFWSALDAATGEILWQTPEPTTPKKPNQGPQGAVTVANGVVFGCTTTPGPEVLFALDASSGEFLWKQPVPSIKGDLVGCAAGAAVVDGVVYWSSLGVPDGHSNYARQTAPKTSENGGFLLAFGLPE